MSESLIFALVIALTVYLFIRRLRLMKQQKKMQAEEEAHGGEPPEDPSSMPRLGTPGTITREQMKQLKDNDFTPERQWSTEEAQLARAYKTPRHPAGSQPCIVNEDTALLLAYREQSVFSHGFRS